MKLAVSNIAWSAYEHAEILAALPGLGMEGVEIAPTMLWPGWLVARSCWENRRWSSTVLIGCMLLGAFASNKDLVGGTLYTLGLWYGSVMAVAAASFFACLIPSPQRGESSSLIPFPERVENRGNEKRAA